MSALWSAIDALFADANVGTAAIYTPAGGAPVSVRVISRRADALTDFGDARLWSETQTLDLRFSDVPDPRPGDRETGRPGDRVEIGGEAYLVQGEPIRDRERLISTIDARPA